MKILILYDGSDQAKKALQALPSARLPGQAEALLIAPVELWPPLPQSCFQQTTQVGGRLLRMAGSLAQLAVAEASATAGEGAERIRRLFPDWVIRPEACTDATPAGLLKRADQWGADCLLLSGKQARRIGRFSKWQCVNDLGRAGALLNRLNTTGNTSERMGHGPSAAGQPV